MKTYTINRSQTENRTVRIEAPSKKEAIKKAKRMNSIEWELVCYDDDNDDKQYECVDASRIKQTVIILGYDVYFDDTQETIDIFTSILGDAYRIAKRAVLETSRPVSINKCKQECFVEQDGTLWGVLDTNSYKKLITICPK